MSATEKVYQTVKFGCIQTALQSKFFTPDDIVTALADAPDDIRKCERMMIAYSYACKAKDPNAHYVRERHILSYVSEPEYAAIFALLRGNPETPLCSAEPNGTKVDSVMMRGMMQMATNPDFQIRVRIITDLTLPFLAPLANMQLVLHARSEHHYKNIPVPRTPDQVDMFLNADFLQHLKSCPLPNIFQLIVKRCVNIAENAPLYWKHVTSSLYRDFIDGLREDNRLKGVKDDDILAFNKLTGFFGKDYEKLSPLARKIVRLKKNIQHYLLGFNIASWAPSDEIVNRALTQLSELGPAKYIEKAAEFHKNAETATKCASPLGEMEIKIRNMEDTLIESVFDYLSYDRISFMQDNNLYFFTRAEFGNLVESKRNHWTGEALPLVFLQQVMSRLEIAAVCNLPKCETASVIYEKLEKGKLFSSDEPKIGEENEDEDAELNDEDDDEEGEDEEMSPRGRVPRQPPMLRHRIGGGGNAPASGNVPPALMDYVMREMSQALGLIPSNNGNSNSGNMHG